MAWYKFDLRNAGKETCVSFPSVRKRKVGLEKKIIPLKWVYKVKVKKGVFERAKAHIVVPGYRQRKGVDYTQTFSPTVGAYCHTINYSFDSFTLVQVH